ncbi:OsmC family protein [Chitinibacter sp. FCG-7]|uniref:OsmC family protein n=1 Tax=Chitinibacter mangrovi TaxID=3153927 RepID=A0AAU7FBM5_9NEIS
MSQDVITVKVTSGSNGYLRIRSREAATAVGRAPDGQNAQDAFRAGELVLGALAACTAGTIRQYAKTHGIDALEDVSVDVTGYESSAPSRIAAIVLRVTLHGGISASERTRLERVARHCKIHNTLLQAPEVELAFDYRATAAAVLVEQELNT